MNYLQDFRKKHSWSQDFTDEEIIADLPKIAPELFGDKPIAEVRSLALQDNNVVADTGRFLASGAISSAADVVTGAERALDADWSADESMKRKADRVESNIDPTYREAVNSAGFREDSQNSLLGIVGTSAKSLGSMASFAPVMIASAIAAPATGGTSIPAAISILGGGVINGLMIGGSSYNGTVEAINSLGESDLNDSPLFNEYLKEEGDFDKAKARMAKDLADEQFKVGAGVGMASGAILGPMLNKAIAGGQGVLRGFVAGAAPEAIQEFGESGAESYGQQKAVSDVTGRPIDKGLVARDAAFGAAMGGIAGGVPGAGIGLLTPRQDVKPDPMKDIEDKFVEASRRFGESKNIDDAIQASNDMLAAKGAVTASDLGMTIPEQNMAGTVDGPMPDSRHDASMKGIDGLIITARKMGFLDEEAKLTVAKRLYTQYKSALDGGDGLAADRYLTQANKLYRDVVDVPSMAPHKDQFPVPYVSMGEVVGGQIVPSSNPNFTMPGGVDVDGAAIPVPANLMENQSQGKLTTDNVIYGQKPEREFTSIPDQYEGVGQNVVGRMAARPIGIERQPVVEGRSISNADLMRPVSIWTGKRGDGYPTEEAAQRGLEGREKADPSLQWAVEQMPSGRFQVAGYGQGNKASVSPTLENDTQPALTVVDETQTDGLIATDSTSSTQAVDLIKTKSIDNLVENQQHADGNSNYSSTGITVSLKSNGQPFASEKAARASGQFRTSPGAEVVPVDGGFGVRVAKTPEPVQVAGDVSKNGGNIDTSAQNPVVNESFTTESAPAPALQNRNRSTPASIEQMTAIASNPDYARLSPSRDFANGAPVVEPGADVVATGRKDTAVTASGRRIPVQYAVVEADSLLPSNNADGSPNPAYARGEDGKSRAIAGNGRVAGLQSAFRRGTATQYVEDLASDDIHGISPDVIRGMKNPVLVRIMPNEEITDTIGDESNTTATAQLSPAEQARNDGKRVDVAGIAMNDDGEVTRQAADQFVAAMPQAEKASLLDGKVPNRQAYDRLQNLIFSEAYESDTLLRLQAEATDPEVRTIMAGLRVAAGKMARLKGAGNYDIRGLVVEAAEVAVNAKRSGQPLAQYIDQADMGRNPAIQPILEMMAANIRSARKIGESLSGIADLFYNEYATPDNDMFGTVQKRRADELTSEYYGTESAPRNPQGAIDTGRPRANEAGSGRQADDGRGQEGAGGAEGQGFQLGQETEADRAAREQNDKEAKDRARKLREKKEKDAKAKEDAKATRQSVNQSVDRFELGQDIDQQLSGQDVMFSRAKDGSDRVTVPKKTAEWMGFDSLSLVADFRQLAHRHPEYYDGPDDVKNDVEYVLENPENWYPHADGRITIVRSRGDGFPSARIDFQREDNGSFRIASVYVQGKNQAIKKVREKDRIIKSLGLGGQIPEGLSIAAYLDASQPPSPRGKGLPSDKKSIDQTASLRNPHTSTTLRAAMDKAFPKVRQALENSGLLLVISADQMPAAIRDGRFSKAVEVPYAAITGTEIDGEQGTTLQAKAINYARANLQGRTFTNEATGWDIGVSRKGINKTTSHSANADHARSMAAIPSLLENAQLIYTEDNRSEAERAGVPYVHVFAAPLSIDGRAYVARLVIKETRDGQKFYDHDLSNEINPANLVSDAHLPKEGADTSPAGLVMTMDELSDVVKSDDRFAPDALYSQDGRVQAYVQNGIAHMVADNISKDANVKGLMMHEIGVHLMQMGRNDADFAKLKKQFELMARQKGSKAEAAMRRAPEGTPEHLRVEESIGYLTEQHPELSFAQKVMAWIRAALKKWTANMPLKDRIPVVRWINELQDADIIYMAQAAVRSAKDARNVRARGDMLSSKAEETLELYHTSSSKIIEVDDSGRFDGFLFFASEPYVMTGNPNYETYKLDIPKSEIIEARSLFYDEDYEKLNDLVAEVQSRYGVDEDVAVGIIDGSTDFYDIGDDLGMDSDQIAEASWDSQLYAAKAAKILGYRGVAVRDEQGTSYLIDMDGRDRELNDQESDPFTESDYRPAVVSWAKERFGNQVAPNGNPAWQNFVEWFGDSKVTDSKGSPLTVYHGTDSDFTVFDRSRGRKWASRVGFWFSDDAQFTEMFGGKQMPVYLAIQNPKVITKAQFDSWRDRHATDESWWEAKKAEMESAGNDGLVVEASNESVGRFTVRNPSIVAAFNPEQIKSADQNTGDFSPQSPDIRYSVGRDEETLATVADRVLAKPERKTVIGKIRQAIDAHRDDWQVWAKQGILDQFASIADLETKVKGALLDASESAYKAAAFSKNSNTVLETAMHFGAVRYVNGGIELVEKSKGLMQILEPLAEGDLLREWEVWAGAVRAKRLLQEGKEKNYTAKDVAFVLSNVYGDKLELFKSVHKDWIAYNKSTLDFAELAGLINAEQRAQWEKDDYVPFHRVSEFDNEDAQTGPNRKGGIAGQKSGINQLTGGVEKISIVEAMVRNTAHMIDASMKNVAMQRTIKLAKELGVVEEVKDAKISVEEAKQRLEAMGIEYDEDSIKTWASLLEKHDARIGTVTVSENGKTKRYIVHDPMLLRAMSSLGPTGVEGIMKVLRIPKRLLTEMITADPSFALRNFVRDSLSTWVTVHEGKRNPLTGAIRGVVKSYQNSEEQMAMMAQGVGGGGFYDTSPEGARAHLDKLAGKGKTITSVGELWKAYRKVLGTTENANRIAIYEAAIKRGATKAEAAYQAMDVLNFSRHGEFKAVRLLIELVPFMNARIQGLERLYRGMKEGTTEWHQFNRSFMIKGAMLTAATLALLASNWDEDDYWDLEEWERDTYYHIFVGGEHYRIPKPFEVGAVFSTIPERMFEQMRDDANTKLLGSRMLHMIADTFALDPTPQFVKPALEVSQNRSSFTGREILSMGMKFAAPEAQYSPYTSKTMIEIADAMPDSAPEWMRSPARLEHLFRGYFGTLGGYVLMGSDYASRQVTGSPVRPELRVRDVPIINSFVRDGVGTNKQVGRVYDMATAVGKVNSAIKKYKDEGLIEKAKELQLDNQAKLKARIELNRATRKMSEISSKMKRIYDHPAMTPSAKRRELDKLIEQRNVTAKTISEKYYDLF